MAMWSALPKRSRMRWRGWQPTPNDWQLLIVDLFLKEGSGLGVLAGCKSRSAGQRVVVLSNYVTVDIRARCEALGADAVFDKSRDLDAFIEYCNTDRPSGLAAL
jgi:DNA-binding NarL/FixJ family response regulator